MSYLLLVLMPLGEDLWLGIPTLIPTALAWARAQGWDFHAISSICNGAKTQVGEEPNPLQIWLRFSKGENKAARPHRFSGGGNPTDFPGTNPCAVSLPAQVAAVGVCAVGASESPSCTMKSCTGNNYICCTSGCFVHPLQLFKSIPCVFTDILSKHLQTLGWQTSTHVNQKLSHNP